MQAGIPEEVSPTRGLLKRPPGFDPSEGTTQGRASPRRSPTKVRRDSKLLKLVSSSHPCSQVPKIEVTPATPIPMAALAAQVTIAILFIVTTVTILLLMTIILDMVALMSILLTISPLLTPSPALPRPTQGQVSPQAEGEEDSPQGDCEQGEDTQDLLRSCCGLQGHACST